MTQSFLLCQGEALRQVPISCREAISQFPAASFVVTTVVKTGVIFDEFLPALPAQRSIAL